MKFELHTKFYCHLKYRTRQCLKVKSLLPKIKPTSSIKEVILRNLNNYSQYVVIMVNNISTENFCLQENFSCTMLVQDAIMLVNLFSMRYGAFSIYNLVPLGNWNIKWERVLDFEVSNLWLLTKSVTFKYNSSLV